MGWLWAALVGAFVTCVAQTGRARDSDGAASAAAYSPMTKADRWHQYVYVVREFAPELERTFRHLF